MIFDRLLKDQSNEAVEGCGISFSPTVWSTRATLALKTSHSGNADLYSRGPEEVQATILLVIYLADTI